MTKAGSANTTAFWRHMFSNWPDARPRRGLIITAWQEHIPFDDYLISEAVLFMSRPQPDGLNARKVMLPFEQIVAVKFPDVFELDVFAPVGFQKKFESEEQTPPDVHVQPSTGLDVGAGVQPSTAGDALDGEPVGVALADGQDAAAAAADPDLPPDPEPGELPLAGLAHLERHIFGQPAEGDEQAVEEHEHGVALAAEGADRGAEATNG